MYRPLISDHETGVWNVRIRLSALLIIRVNILSQQSMLPISLLVLFRKEVLANGTCTVASRPVQGSFRNVQIRFNAAIHQPAASESDEIV